MKKNQKGQSLLEFALLLPILLVILAGILDLGRLYYAYVAVTDAAAEGAAYAAIHPEASDEDIAIWANATSKGLVDLETDGTVTVIRPIIQAGYPVTVTVSYDFAISTPIINQFFQEGTIPLEAVATEVMLRNP